MIIWIIGLSSSGKTTLAREIIKKRREQGGKVILLDGDEVRNLFKNDLDHTVEGRKLNAERISRLCKFLDDQKIDVICAILSIFEESRDWCRENFSSYYEIYLDTPMELLKSRDPKGIYSSYHSGEMKNVAGLDLKFEEPKNADLHIKNDKSIEELLKYADIILKKITN